MNLQRRTRCVYCGARIPGALPAHVSRKRREQRFAARFACHLHRRLVACDPAFEWWFERDAA